MSVKLTLVACFARVSVRTDALVEGWQVVGSVTETRAPIQTEIVARPW